VEHQRAPRLRLIHVFAIGAGAMFSSGFFLLPGIAAAETGPSLPLAYLLAGLLVLPTMLSVTELAVAMPLAGGPYHFYRRALGPTIATVGGVGLWVALVLKAAFALVGIDAYLSILFELPSGAVGVVLAAVFTVLNLMGARESANIQVGLVAVLLVVLSAFIVVGGVNLTGTDREEFVDEFSPLFSGGVFGLVAATGIVFVAFAGLPQVASVAGEIRDPGRAIPRGILLGSRSRDHRVRRRYGSSHPVASGR
jgi:basic amino acid/polyamine antiporter, APA family